jgi:hypothetical protein
MVTALARGMVVGPPLLAVAPDTRLAFLAADVVKSSGSNLALPLLFSFCPKKFQRFEVKEAWWGKTTDLYVSLPRTWSV